MLIITLHSLLYFQFHLLDYSAVIWLFTYRWCIRCGSWEHEKHCSSSTDCISLFTSRKLYDYRLRGLVLYWIALDLV